MIFVLRDWQNQMIDFVKKTTKSKSLIDFIKKKFGKMPKGVNVTREEAIRVVEKYIEYFKTGTIPASDSDVWRKISEDINYKWSPVSAYITMRDNRRAILSTARANKGIIIEQEKNNDLGTDNRVNTSVPLETWFHLLLDEKMWDQVRPKSIVVGRRKLEQYEVAYPTEWTDAIFHAFFEKYHFPCVYVLVKAKVYTSPGSKYYIEMHAKCKSQKCSNTFLGFVECSDKTNTVKIKTQSTCLDSHEVMQHPARSTNGQHVEDKTVTKRTTRQKNNAEKEHDLGQKQKKDEGKQADVEFAENMRINRSQMDGRLHDDSIQEIGSIPFRVFYTTPHQMQVFNKYCQQEHSVVKIDMRKDLVRKINRGNNLESGEIFLISMIINSNGKTFLAYQMISEGVDFPLIEYWLRSWLQKGAHKPKEAVSSYCRVFLAAMCLVFNGFSLEHYIGSQFALVSNAGLDHERQMAMPKTFIRVDPKNLLQVVSQWRCFGNACHPYVRGFYVRCVDLLMRAETFDEFTELLFFTIVVAVSLFEDYLLETEQFTPRMIRKKLHALIAAQNNVEVADYDEENDFEQEQPVLENSLIYKGELAAITLWVDEIVKKAKSLSSRGSEVNAFYLPKFADQLVTLALDFSLWTSFTPVIQDTPPWNIEEYFKNWKPRILEKVPFAKRFPVQADHFVIAHLLEITEAAKTFDGVHTDSQIEQISADGTQKSRGSDSNEEVSLLPDDTSFLTEYLYDFLESNSTTSGSDVTAVVQNSDEPARQSSANSPGKSINSNVLLSQTLEMAKSRYGRQSNDSSLGLKRKRKIDSRN